MPNFTLKSVTNIPSLTSDFDDTSIVNPMVSYSDQYVFIIGRVRSAPVVKGSISNWKLTNNYQGNENHFMIEYTGAIPKNPMSSSIYAFLVESDEGISKGTHVDAYINEDYTGSKFAEEPIRRTRVIV